jgi:two-component sensor histidine kinase
LTIEAGKAAGTTMPAKKP